MLIRYTPAQIADIVFCRAHNPAGAPRTPSQAMENLKRLGFGARQIDPHFAVLHACVLEAALDLLSPATGENLDLLIAVNELTPDPSSYLGVRIDHPQAIKLLTAIEDAARALFLEDLEDRAKHWALLMIPGTDGVMPAPQGFG